MDGQAFVRRASFHRDKQTYAVQLLSSRIVVSTKATAARGHSSCFLSRVERKIRQLTSLMRLEFNASLRFPLWVIGETTGDCLVLKCKHLTNHVTGIIVTPTTPGVAVVPVRYPHRRLTN